MGNEEEEMKNDGKEPTQKEAQAIEQKGVSSKETSVIKIIQQMMRTGESEDAIVKALIEMGIEESQARRLITVAQADTLALLQAEIGKIAREQIENEIPALQTYIDRTFIQTKEELERKLKADMRADINELRDDVKKDVKLLHDVTENMDEKIEKIEDKINDLRAEVKEIRMRRLGTKNEWVSLLLVLGGIAFNVSALYLFFTEFQNITMDSLILIIVIALTGITMLFGSSII